MRGSVNLVREPCLAIFAHNLQWLNFFRVCSAVAQDLFCVYIVCGETSAVPFPTFGTQAQPFQISIDFCYISVHFTGSSCLQHGSDLVLHLNGGEKRQRLSWLVKTVSSLCVALWCLQFAVKSPGFAEQTSCVSCYSRMCKCCLIHTREWCLTADEKNWMCRNWEMFILRSLFWYLPATSRPPGRKNPLQFPSVLRAAWSVGHSCVTRVSLVLEIPGFLLSAFLEPCA